jgi:hypothetical protein
MVKISYDKTLKSNRIKTIVEWFMKTMDLYDENFKLRIIASDSKKMIKRHGITHQNNYGLAYSVGDTYYVEIKKSLLACSETLLYEILLEELCHIYQFLKENLTFDKETRKWSYENVDYPEDMPYDSMPWEINAKAWSKKLLKTYKQKL